MLEARSQSATVSHMEHLNAATIDESGEVDNDDDQERQMSTSRGHDEREEGCRVEGGEKGLGQDYGEDGEVDIVHKEEREEIMCISVSTRVLM